MKRYLMFVLLTMCVSISYAMTSAIADNAPVQMTVRKHTTNKNNYEFERNEESYIVNVFFDTHNKEIECELYNIGSTDVYIVDRMGNIIDEKHIDTDVPILVCLSTVLCNGEFYIVVGSEYVYAEGVINQ